MNQAINQWGPAILVCFTILIGIVTNNRRIDDLRSDLIARIEALEKHVNARIDDRINNLRNEMIARIDGLEKRIVDRIERLEHPIFKG
jgi:hypothetical protein